MRVEVSRLKAAAEMQACGREDGKVLRQDPTTVDQMLTENQKEVGTGLQDHP